jgi:hypothetical protein
MKDSYVWIKDLAVADSTRDILNYEKHSNPTSVLREESYNMLAKLNLLFFEYSEVFNRSIREESTPLKVLGITANKSFIVFRNNYRLVASIFEPGVILFSFENFAGNIYSNVHEPKDNLSPDEVYHSGNILIAELGPFNEVTWLFEEKRVEAHKVVRHYFTEFIKASTTLMKNAPVSLSPARSSDI